jgi:anti-anti-sigma regulatory factor
VTVAGELDLAGAGLVTAMLDHVCRRQAGPARAADRADQVDVDLAGVTFVDSHGLASVLDARARIVAASEPVRRVRRLLDGARAHPDPDWYAASA